jgi:hypothetical protein
MHGSGRVEYSCWYYDAAADGTRSYCTHRGPDGADPAEEVHRDQEIILMLENDDGFRHAYYAECVAMDNAADAEFRRHVAGAAAQPLLPLPPPPLGSLASASAAAGSEDAAGRKRKRDE